MTDHTDTAGGWSSPPKQATSEIQSIADRVSENTQFFQVVTHTQNYIHTITTHHQ